MSDSDDIVSTIRRACETELSRLGSSRALYAITDGEIDTDPVLRAAAEAENAAWKTFEQWAADETTEEVATFFGELAETERRHYETVCAELGEDVSTPDGPPPMHIFLREQTDTIDRLGAFLGRTVASAASKSQIVGYFVGNADPGTADVFRGFGEDLDDQLEAGTTLLEKNIDSVDERERAIEAGTGAIEMAYEEYVDTLTELDVNPKPVC